MQKNLLSDKDMLQDAIMSEKLLAGTYNTGVIESANTNVFTSLQQIMNEKQIHAQVLFEAMNQRGWYPLKSAHDNQTANQQLCDQIGTQNTTI